MVPSGRIELPRPYEQQILSLPRLPIPPQGHKMPFNQVAIRLNILNHTDLQDKINRKFFYVLGGKQ